MAIRRSGMRTASTLAAHGVNDRIPTDSATSAAAPVPAGTPSGTRLHARRADGLTHRGDRPTVGA